jgi:hypothetical protein
LGRFCDKLDGRFCTFVGLHPLFACWLWQIYISNSVPSYKSMTVIATGPAALALAITEFIACLFYIIQEQPQGQSKGILISSLVFVILINMYFGIFGFLL